MVNLWVNMVECRDSWSRFNMQKSERPYIICALSYGWYGVSNGWDGQHIPWVLWSDINGGLP